MAASGGIITTVLLGTFIMISIAVTVILFVMAHKKRYLRQEHVVRYIKFEREHAILNAVIRTQEEERSRIATSLHDDLGAKLSMLKLNLTKHAYRIKKEEFNLEAFDKDVEILSDTIETLRNNCRNLYPVALENYGFVRIFEQLLEGLNDSDQIVCQYKIDLSEEDLFRDVGSRLSLLRILQEVLNNLIKHAGCTTLEVVLTISDEILKIVFRHNGVGFDNNDVKEFIAQNKGLGLFSINNRLDLMRGKINYIRVADGSEVIIELPVKNA